MSNLHTIRLLREAMAAMHAARTDAEREAAVTTLIAGLAPTLSPEAVQAACAACCPGKNRAQAA